MFLGTIFCKEYSARKMKHGSKLTLNNPKLDVININAYAKFGQNPSKFSQDIERKRKCY